MSLDPHADYVSVIDISESQGSSNPAIAVKQGVEGVILRAAHGFHEDAKARENWRAWTSVLAPEDVHWYHFANTKRGAAAKSAAFLVSTIHDITGEAPLHLMHDFEDVTQQNPNTGDPGLTGQAYHDWCAEFIATVSQLSPTTHQYAYSNDGFWRGHCGLDGIPNLLEWMVPRYPYTTSAQYVGHPLPGTEGWRDWAFARQPAGPVPPMGTKNVAGWQFSAEGNSQGVYYGFGRGDLDLNIILASTWDRWHHLHDPAPVPPSFPSPINLGADMDGVSFIITCTDESGQYANNAAMVTFFYKNQLELGWRMVGDNVGALKLAKQAGTAVSVSGADYAAWVAGCTPIE